LDSNYYEAAFLQGPVLVREAAVIDDNGLEVVVMDACLLYTSDAADE